MVAVSNYHRMPIAQKRAEALARARDSALRCPQCDMQVMPVDLLAHIEQRCAGPAEPGPGAKWIVWRDVLAMGVKAMTLSDWARKGLVRTEGERGDRQYLLRDLLPLVIANRARRRR